MSYHINTSRINFVLERNKYIIYTQAQMFMHHSPFRFERALLMTQRKLDIVLIRTSQVTVGTVSLSHAFMTTRIRFNLIQIAELQNTDICGRSCKVHCRTLCFIWDRPESPGTFRFKGADLRLRFSLLVFLTVSLTRLSQPLIGHFMCLSSCEV